MLPYSHLISGVRKELGLTQSDLGRLSGISLPFIQNIERGVANPSIKTLSALLEVLGLHVSLLPSEPNWMLLAQYGLPLTTDSSARLVRPTANDLAPLLARTCAYVQKNRSTFAQTRELGALQAFLLAIHEGFPSFYSRFLARSPAVSKTFPRVVSGKLIKLKRIALAQLAEYL